MCDNVWQEILAVDSRLSSLRMAKDPNLRAIYLKRRMQLLQGAGQRRGADQEAAPGPVRNRSYLSLRVKLLKGQLGSSSDTLSLSSLAIATNDHNDNAVKSAAVASPHSSASVSAASFGGVAHIFDHHTAAVTRIKFLHGSDSVFVSGGADGRVAVASVGENPAFLVVDGPDSTSALAPAILDVDVSESDQLAVSCSSDGRVTLWDLSRVASVPMESKVTQVRCVRVPDANDHAVFGRFLPENNNIVVCGLRSGSVRAFNTSTGKWCAWSSPTAGTPTCAAMAITGGIIWVGGARGHVESFKMAAATNILKGCRVHLDTYITAMTAHSAHRMLVVAQAGAAYVSVMRVVDDFGTVEPLARLSASSALRSITLAPLWTSSGSVVAAAGTNDGALLFLDVERARGSTSSAGSSCSSSSSTTVNRLLGHAAPVIAATFSPNEVLLASADSSGQIIVWKK